MTLDYVKSYLRVDDDYDDGVISELMEVAEAEVSAAVGAFDEGDPKARLLYCAIVQDLYDHRTLMQGEASRQRMGHVIRSMVLQLQLDNSGEGTDEEGDGG